MNEATKTNQFGLPYFFKPLLWSFDFEKVDPDRHRKSIIVNAVNYGDLSHWKWIHRHYTPEDIQEFFKNTLVTEFRPSALKLASILFKTEGLKHV